MVVCKFFQQGYCRYGQNCRFEHIFGNKYSYHATSINNAQAVTDEQLVNQVQADVQAAIRGGQWILSTYSPFKEKPNFPGLIDISPEEARLSIYEAKANNNLDQAISNFNNAVRDARSKYEQLLKPTSNIIKVLRHLYNGEKPESPFSSVSNNIFGITQNTQNAASSIFRTAVQTNSSIQITTQNDIYTNPNEIFSQVRSPNTNVFFNSQTKNDTAKSIFAQASQNFFASSNLQNTSSNNIHSSFQQSSPNNIFGSANQGNAEKNIFGSQSSSVNNIFASAAQKYFNTPDPNNSSPFKNNSMIQTNLFSKPEQTQSIFGQPSVPSVANIFTQNHGHDSGVTNANSTNIFEQSTAPNIFEQSSYNTFEQYIGNNDIGIYSKEEDLNPEDIETYKNDDFQLGFIPELPPTRILCF